MFTNALPFSTVIILVAIVFVILHGFLTWKEKKLLRHAALRYPLSTYNLSSFAVGLTTILRHSLTIALVHGAASERRETERFDLAIWVTEGLATATFSLYLFAGYFEKLYGASSSKIPSAHSTDPSSRTSFVRSPKCAKYISYLLWAMIVIQVILSIALPFVVNDWTKVSHHPIFLTGITFMFLVNSIVLVQLGAALHWQLKVMERCGRTFRWNKKLTVEVSRRVSALSSSSQKANYIPPGTPRKSILQLPGGGIPGHGIPRSPFPDSHQPQMEQVPHQMGLSSSPSYPKLFADQEKFRSSYGSNLMNSSSSSGSSRASVNGALIPSSADVLTRPNGPYGTLTYNLSNMNLSPTGTVPREPLPAYNTELAQEQHHLLGLILTILATALLALYKAVLFGQGIAGHPIRLYYELVFFFALVIATGRAVLIKNL